MKRSLLIRITAVAIICGFIGLAGCKTDKTIVLTTGFAEDEVFKIDSALCTRQEVMIYMTNIQNSYEAVYGEEIWDTAASGVPIKESVKETVLARLSKVKVMTLMAGDKGISLTEEEENKTRAAAKEYFASLSGKERELFLTDEEQLAGMYRDYALAQKVYAGLVSGINPEISDDAARSVTLSYIKIRTYHTDLDGNTAPYSDTYKRDAKRRAEEIYALYTERESFESLILDYNEDDRSQCSIRRGEADPVLEEAAFNLGKDEVSPVLETGDGFYIIKVINVFDKKEADANKQAMIQEMRDEAFEEAYENFLSGLTGNLNEELWNEIDFPEDPEITTHSFFYTYEKYFLPVME